MKHIHLLLIGLLALLIAACDPVESQPTAIAAASASVTRTPAPIQTATITPMAPHIPSTFSLDEETLLPSTKTPHPTSTTAPTPTQTPYIPPSPLPPASLPDPSVQYVLSTPDPNQLVAVADMVTQKRSDLNRNWSDEAELNHPFYSYFPDESRAVLDLVAYDLWRYYPNGFPGANVDTAIHSQHLQWALGLSVWLENYLIGYAIHNLNQEQIVFQADQSVTVNNAFYLPYPIELDGDPESEWLTEVRVVNPEDNWLLLQTWLLLDENTDGDYIALPNDIPLSLYGDTDSYEELLFDFDHDINGDSISDVVISYLTYFGGTVSGSFLVYIWSGSSLALVGEGDLPGVSPLFGETNQSTYEISDFDGDGRDEIRVTWPRFAEFGCEWQTLTTYDWNEKELVARVENEDVPVGSGEVGCYITQAMWSDQPEDKTHWFEMAYWALPNDSPADLEAWVLLRLMAAYYGQGRHQEAVQTVQSLNELTGDGKFVDAVREAIASTDASPLEVCRAMYERASEGKENYRRFGSDIDDYLQYNGYPIWGDPDPRKVCPYSELTYDNMLNVRVSANIPPAEAYAAAGFTLELAQAFNIDLDPEEEWLAVYQNHMLLLDSTGEYWHADIIFDEIQEGDSIAAMQPGMADVTGDQVPELLIMVTMSEPYYEDHWWGGSCDPGEKNFLFITFNLTNIRYQRGRMISASCRSQPLPNLGTKDGIIEFLSPWEEYTNPGVSGIKWRLMIDMPGKPDTYQNIYEYIDDIEDKILAGTDLGASHQALKTLIAYIPSVDPEAAFIVPRLQYLLGLSYEIEGCADEAVEAYLALIQSTPQSAWSWLAWTRLAAP